MVMGIAVNVLVNFSLTGILLTQGFYMSKLSRNYYLDGIKWIQFYKLYFILIGISIIGIACLSYENYHKLIFLILIGVFTIMQAFQDTSIHNEVDQIEEITTENDYLITNSIMNNHNNNISNNELTQVKSSKPVSLLAIEDSDKKLMSEPNSRRSSTLRVSSKSPILALLLSGNGALAMELSSSPSSPSPIQQMPNPWSLLIISIIIFTFIISQIVYSVSIFKTNLYLPARHQYAMFGTTAFTSLLIVGLISFTSICLNDLIINLPIQRLFNLIIPICVLIQSLTSLILFHKSSTNLHQSFSSVTIYDSASSPSFGP